MARWEKWIKKGPVSWDKLCQLAANGTLDGTDLVWCDEMAEWQPAETIDGLCGEPDWHYAQDNQTFGPVTKMGSSA